MAITIVMTKELGNLWASAEELARMTDEEIIDLVLEDRCELTNEATFKIERTDK